MKSIITADWRLPIDIMTLVQSSLCLTKSMKVRLNMCLSYQA